MLDRMVVGEVPRKHHIALRDAAGNLRFEECITRRGFDGPYTIAYHTRRPHTARAVPVGHGWNVPSKAEERPLLRRHFKSGDVAGGGAPVNARKPLLFNQD